jgi:Homeodomain-like domain
MTEATKPDKTRQLSQEQENAVEHLLQGKSDRAVADAVGVSRQTVSEWKNHDPLFIAELNRQRSELWREAHQRLKSLANRALDAVELQLDSGDPKASLAAAKYILQGTRLLGDTDLPMSGPTTPEGVIMAKLRNEARMELEADGKHIDPFKVDLFGIEDEVEDLAKSRLMKALAEAGLS